MGSDCLAVYSQPAEIDTRMASLSRAVNTVASGDFLMTTGLFIGGLYAGRLATDFMRNNVVDLGMTGADAVYALVGASATLAFLPNRFARPLAIGMMASGTQTAAREAGVL